MKFALGPITTNPFNVIFVQEWAYFYGHDGYEMETIYKKVNLNDGEEVALKDNQNVQVWEHLVSN